MWLGRVLGQQASHACFLSALRNREELARGDANGGASSIRKMARLCLTSAIITRRRPASRAAERTRRRRSLRNSTKLTRPELRNCAATSPWQQKDYTTAENDYRQAATVATEPADYWTVLANFYRGRQQWTDLDAAIQNCIAAAAKDKNSGVGLYDGAGVLIAAKRNPSLAAQMLENYLSSSSLTEEAPAFIAHIRLSRLKQQLGDAAGAKSELAIAAQMAKEFNPAQD